MSVVLDIQPSEDYEPSNNEIVEYGKWLGMTFPEDLPFLWIAREGLKAPLPEYWKACKSEKGELYYFNFKTGESIWDHPLDEHYKELFKREKLNPTPQSIINGAKKKPEKVKRERVNTVPRKSSRNELTRNIEDANQNDSNNFTTENKKHSSNYPANKLLKKNSNNEVVNDNINNAIQLKEVSIKREIPAELYVNNINVIKPEKPIKLHQLKEIRNDCLSEQRIKSSSSSSSSSSLSPIECKALSIPEKKVITLNNNEVINNIDTSRTNFNNRKTIDYNNGEDNIKGVEESIITFGGVEGLKRLSKRNISNDTETPIESTLEHEHTSEKNVSETNNSESSNKICTETQIKSEIEHLTEHKNKLKNELEMELREFKLSMQLEKQKLLEECKSNHQEEIKLLHQKIKAETSQLMEQSEQEATRIREELVSRNRMYCQKLLTESSNECEITIKEKEYIMDNALILSCKSLEQNVNVWKDFCASSYIELNKCTSELLYSYEESYKNFLNEHSKVIEKFHQNEQKKLEFTCKQNVVYGGETEFNEFASRCEVPLESYYGRGELNRCRNSLSLKESPSISNSSMGNTISRKSEENVCSNGASNSVKCVNNCCDVHISPKHQILEKSLELPLTKEDENMVNNRECDQQLNNDQYITFLTKKRRDNTTPKVRARSLPPILNTYALEQQIEENECEFEISNKCNEVMIKNILMELLKQAINSYSPSVNVDFNSRFDENTFSNHSVMKNFENSCCTNKKLFDSNRTQVKTKRTHEVQNFAAKQQLPEEEEEEEELPQAVFGKSKSTSSLIGLSQISTKDKTKYNLSLENKLNHNEEHCSCLLTNANDEVEHNFNTRIENQEYPCTDVAKNYPSQIVNMNITKSNPLPITPNVNLFFSDKVLQSLYEFIEEKLKHLKYKREQLRSTKHEWKRDLLEAKRCGVKSNTKLGNELKTRHVVLDNAFNDLTKDEHTLIAIKSYLNSKKTCNMQNSENREQTKNVKGLQNENNKITYKNKRRESAFLVNKIKSFLPESTPFTHAKESNSVNSYYCKEKMRNCEQHENELLEKISNFVELQHGSSPRKIRNAKVTKLETTLDHEELFDNNQLLHYPQLLREILHHLIRLTNNMNYQYSHLIDTKALDKNGKQEPNNRKAQSCQHMLKK